MQNLCETYWHVIYIVSFVLLCLISCKTEQVVEPPMSLPVLKFVPEHSPIVFLILYDAEIGKEPVLKAIKEYKCEIVYDYHNMNGMALRKPKDKSLDETMQYFRSVKGCCPWNMITSFVWKTPLNRG